MEKNAGTDSHFSDNDYSEAGAEIADDRAEVFKADVIVKVAPPQLDEIELMQLGQTLISPLHLPTINRDYISRLMEKKITALAFEYTKDLAGFFPFVRC
ncbi:MAG TPA: alanine dehydrogenase, partial [Chitinophagales bacterium]